MFECNLDFSPSSSRESGSYKLIELTPDLATCIENALRNNTDLRSDFLILAPQELMNQCFTTRLTIKGHSNEDAVLCTEDKTFTMRSVALSNTILVVTPIPDDPSSNFSDDAVVIRDQLNEVIEPVPIVPRLHKLSAMIRDRQYDEGQEDDDTRELENKVCQTS
jgi:sister chromatid cohesion protein DCC1